jgi:hypothetical protein
MLSFREVSILSLYQWIRGPEYLYIYSSLPSGSFSPCWIFYANFLPRLNNGKNNFSPCLLAVGQGGENDQFEANQNSIKKMPSGLKWHIED